jgi:hypothetical protein
MATKIKFYRENTVNINLAFPGVDLTGATVYLTIKADYDNDQADASALIKKDVTSHTDPTNGLTKIALAPSETSVAAGEYGYDVKLKKATGEQTTVMVGLVEVLDAYTLRA